MQDIVFYAAANETLGVVRDYANTRKVQAPVLTIGVSVCLRMRLFADLNTSTPYPISAFAGISDWQWRMDGDFDQTTTCKLVADTNDILVQSVSDTINGETISFTEFVIPISDMNTQELQAWLGSEKKRSGLTGELIGYDSAEKAAFVLQIENFTVRNRVAGLGNPTAVDLETVTYDQAANMIRTAVSSSAATKQDKLNSANAGTGISIADGGTISTANVPQSAITGLSASLAAKQDNITAGDLLEFTSGTALNRKRYMPVFKEAGMSRRSITPAGGTTSVQALVLEPGNAYQINAVSSSKWFATTATFKDSSEQWGLESHIKLFVAGTGYVRTDNNVVLADALEPDAVNNCTVRFQDGLAIISVEDHIGGYIVVSASGTSSGSLYYGLVSATNEYIAVDASLNGRTIDLGGATTYAGEKHVVGNGYAETILSGGIVCTSKTTFANLSMDGVSFFGGTATLGDVYIPQGATVSVSGGGLAIEKVTGNGGVIDLGGTTIIVPSSGTANASGCTFTGGARAILVSAFASMNLNSCVIAGNTDSQTVAGGMNIKSSAVVSCTNCIVSGNYKSNGSAGDICIGDKKAVCYLTGCTVGRIELATGAGFNTDFASAVLVGYNKFDLCTSRGTTNSGTVIISSGAIVDLTGNTNATPINPGGGITFAPGGATVYPSAGSASAYVLGGMTVPQIGNTNVVNLSGTNVIVSGGTAHVSGGTITNGSNSVNGGAFYCSYGTLVASSATFSGNVTTSNGGVALITGGGEMNFSGCTFSGNTAGRSGGALLCGTGRYLNMTDCTITGNTARAGGGIFCYGSADISSCVISGNIATSSAGKDVSLRQNQTTFGGCTLGSIGLNDSILTFEKTNTVDLIEQVPDGASGTVIISAGAKIDLSNASSGNAIAPGGTITLYCGAGASATYLVTGGNISRFYKDADRLVGSTITNVGIIYGATVYFPSAENTYEVGYTTDSGTTYQTVDVTGTTEYVVTGGLMSLQQKTV